MTVQIGTIRSLIDHSYSLRACCNGCGHNVELDLDSLGRRLGFDHSTMHGDLAGC
jgi:hypothetical protein